MSKLKTERDVKKPAAGTKEAPPPDGGWRETVESVAMAVILALLFRGFVAEAFVIPTGSMAPTLVGRHKDLKCPKCGNWYQVSGSPEQSYDVLTGDHVINGTCTVCRYTQRLNPRSRPNEGSFSGDRIIVGKFCYDLEEPKRWDVIVFKFPGSASTNYIKRLIGLPGERVFIIGGNIYTCDKDEPNEPDGSPPRALRIARKSPEKLGAMLQMVDDSDHVPEDLAKIGWPARWQNWPAVSGESAGWEVLDGGRAFACKGTGDGESWLRYRNLVPTYEDWKTVEERHELPAGVADRTGELIADFYSYNTATEQQAIHSDVVPLWQWPLTKGYRPPADILPGGPMGDPPPADRLGDHWVDDLALECTAEVTGNQGELSLLLVRGGTKHICRINLADGKATMSMTEPSGQAMAFLGDDGSTADAPTASTNVKGPGRYRLRLTNCDHEMRLLVNGAAVEFNGPTTYDSDNLMAPYYSAADPGDVAPAGIASRGATVKLSQLRILRDKYYIATTDYMARTDYDSPLSSQEIRRVFANPAEWDSSRLFAPDNRRYVGFLLEADQFLPMGDNSPQSSDSRLWSPANDRDKFPEPHHYVERDLLIGKALLIYWPHTWNRPIPFLPKFSRMGPIR